MSGGKSRLIDWILTAVWISVTIGFSAILAFVSYFVLKLFLEGTAPIFMSIPLGVAYWWWLWKMITHFRNNMHLPTEELLDEMESLMGSPEQRARMKRLRQQQSWREYEDTLNK